MTWPISARPTPLQITTHTHWGGLQTDRQPISRGCTTCVTLKMPSLHHYSLLYRYYNKWRITTLASGILSSPTILESISAITRNRIFSQHTKFYKEQQSYNENVRYAFQIFNFFSLSGCLQRNRQTN